MWSDLCCYGLHTSTKHEGAAVSSNPAYSQTGFMKGCSTDSFLNVPSFSVQLGMATVHHSVGDFW